MSRHRGAKPPRRCGLLGRSACYPRVPFLSVERWPFHAEPPDHYDRLSSLLDLFGSRSQAGLCHCTHQLVSDQPEPEPSRASVTLLGGDRPSQTTRHAGSRPRLTGLRLDINNKGGISRLAPPDWRPASKPPTYPTHVLLITTAKAVVKVHGVFPSDRG